MKTYVPTRAGCGPEEVFFIPVCFNFVDED